MNTQFSSAHARLAARRLMTAPTARASTPDAAAEARRRAATYERLYCASTAAHAETLARLAEVTAERDRLWAAASAGSAA